MQSSRFELKYIVSEACALQVAHIARAYLTPDPYAPEPGGSYAVHSLYLDGPGLPLCRSTLEGHRKRFKLRARWYDHDPVAPVFCEIKSRNDKVIGKERVQMTRAAADRLCNAMPIGNAWPSAPADMLSMQRFCSKRDDLNATGRAIVSYDREAYVSECGNALRITIDRNVTGYLPGQQSPTIPFGEGRYADVGGTIVELKFTSRFPAWMGELVQGLQLDRCPVPKYVLCARALRLNVPTAATVIGRSVWTS